MLAQRDGAFFDRAVEDIGIESAIVARRQHDGGKGDRRLLAIGHIIGNAKARMACRDHGAWREVAGLRHGRGWATEFGNRA